MSVSTLTQVPLHTVADVIDPHPSHRAPGRVNQGIPFVGIGDLSKNTGASFPDARKVSRSIFDEHAARYDLQEGLLGLGRVASVGLVVDLPIPAEESPYVVSPTLAVIRAKSIDKTYLKYQLMSPQVQLQLTSLKQGSGRESVGVQKLRNVLIQSPPLHEQHRIVETLDDHLSRLDKALAEVKSASLQTSTLRRSVLEEALFGESSLPWTTLGEHVQTRKNKGIPSQEPHAKYLGLEHVESHGGRILGFDSASKYRSASPIVEQGDLLYGRLRPYLNKVVLAPERLYVSGEFIVMMPTATLDSKFLKHLLMSPRFLAFTALLDTGDRPRVSWDKIANFEFQIPDLAFQKRIVEQIESSLDVAGSINADIERLDSQVVTLRRALLHSAFAGKMTNG